MNRSRGRSSLRCETLLITAPGKRMGMQTKLGVLLAMFGGIMVGNCMVPLNYLRRWRWENAWIVFSLVALILIPWTLAFLRVPNLPAVYAGFRIGSFVMPVLFG